MDLKQDSPKHGNVVLQQLVPLRQFQADLAATRAHWTIDETQGMTRRPLPTNSSYEQSVQGLRRLHALALAGRNESPEADAVRAELQRNWQCLSEVERN